MKQDARDLFANQLACKLGGKYTLRWEVDEKGVAYGWCKLTDAADIISAAELVAGFKGRVMTITSLIAASNEKSEHIEIKYHFYFEGVNCTVGIRLPDGVREVNSITPVLKSADWHEREMQELYNIKVVGHPNPKRLFLDESIKWTDHTMIPLSEALNGASTNTLWERVMRSKSGEVNTDE